MSQIRRRQIGKNSSAPLPVGAYWIDTTSGLKYIVLEDNTTVEVTYGTGSWPNGLYIPATCNDTGMTVYDSEGDPIKASGLTYNVVHIPNNAFVSKSIDKWIEVAEGITSIGKSCFTQANSAPNNTSIKWVKLPKSLTKAGENNNNAYIAYKYSGVTKINFGGITTIGPYFEGPWSSTATSVRLMVFEGTTLTFGHNAFNRCGAIATVGNRIRMVFTSITQKATFPGWGNPFGSGSNDYIDLYVPDALVNDFRADSKWVNAIGADDIHPLSDYEITEDYPDYNF